MLRELTRYVALFFILLHGIGRTFAQPFPVLRFRHLTTKDGLSDNQVTGITEDKDGFIWFNTLHGANRYDGYRIKQFLSDGGISDGRMSDTGSNGNPYANLTGSANKTVYEDKKGRQWTFADNRLFLLDREHKRPPRVFQAPDPLKIYRIYFDSDDRCWLATRANGLYRFIPEGDQWEPVNTGTGGLSGSITEWKINDRTYIVYISENNTGLILIDPVTLVFHRYQDDAFAIPLLGDNGVGTVFADKRNDLWIGTQRGISYVTPSSQLLEIIPVGPQETTPDFSRLKVVFALYNDRNGYWLSKWYAGGLFHYTRDWKPDKYLSALCPGAAQQPNRTSIAFDMRMYRGLMYTTTDSGLVEWDTASLRARIIQPENTTHGATLRTILPVNDTTWWIQSYYSGIYVFDPRHRQFINRYLPGTPNVLSGKGLPEKIVEIFRSARGGIYLCSYKGLLEYQPAVDDFITYRKDKNDSLSFPSDSLYGITEDREGRLWIGTSKGLCVFNPAQKKIERVFPENDRVGSVNALCTDKYDNIWLATSTGPWCRLARSGQFIHLNVDEALPENSGDGILVALDDGGVYDGCLDALVRFHPERLQGYATASDPATAATPSSPVDSATTTTARITEAAVGDQPVPLYTLLIRVNPSWWQTWWVRLLAIMIMACLVILLVGRRLAHLRRDSALQQQQAFLRQRIAETEMQALRAQMNPHFIFNSLNSIENFMMKNDKRMASDYFSKFATLMRLIMDSTRNEWVPFGKDMEALKLYVELEQLRFDHRFSYHTIIDPTLSATSYKVPPLLIQPYVENAIIHGLAQSRKEGLELSVTALLDGPYIVYTVLDNGIGRKQSTLYRAGRTFHKSMGMEITRQRIEVLNQQRPEAGEVEITDLYDEQDEPAGTRVQVRIKALLTVLALVCCFSGRLLAQNHYVDSLINWVKTHPKIDSIYIQNLHRISYRLSEKDIRQSFDYYERVSMLSDSLNFTYGKALAQINFGILLSNSANFEASNGAYLKAIEYAQACGAQRLKAISLNNVADNFYSLKDFERSRHYAGEAVEINRQLHAWRGVAINYELLHRCAFEEKEYGDAENRLREGMPFAQKADESYILSQYYLGFGKLQAVTARRDSARFYFTRAMEQATRETDLRNEYDVYIAQAQYLKETSFSQKRQWLDSALGIARRTGYTEGVSTAAQKLSQLYDELKNKDSSYYYYRVFRLAYDSVFSENNRSMVIKESEVMIRRQESENRNLKELAKLQDQEISVKNGLLLAVLISLLSVIVIAFFINRSIRFRKKREEATLKQKIAETQMLAMRAKMSPHFIFNSINSIENFILQNEKRLAADYLSKFSRFIRSVLDSSHEELVSFTTDIQTMQLYIDLEQLRFNNKFIYQTNIDPVLLDGYYRVPSLLVQPYLGNAIVHGIAHSEKPGLHLILTAWLDKEYIKYTIEDNGVGREQAAQYKAKKISDQKSIGLQVTGERINIFNQTPDGDGNVEIIDLFDENNDPAGTRVEIRIRAIPA